MANDFQLEMFATLSALADRATYKHESLNGYIAIAIEAQSYPNTNAVTIHKNHNVSFFTQKRELLDQATSVGFEVSPRPDYVDGHKFHQVAIADVQRNAPLFKQLVNDSVAIVSDRYNATGRKKSGEPR
jgi:hypothetical protein